jgi:hypothetical protein
MKRVLKLPGVEFQVETEVETKRQSSAAASSAERGGAGAAWWDFRIFVGLIATGLAIVETEWWLLLLGVPLIVLGTWKTLSALEGRSLLRRLVWIAIDLAVVGAFLAVAVLIDLNQLVLLALVVIAVFGGPILATWLTKVRER